MQNSDSNAPQTAVQGLSDATSELNNLLQIIAQTNSILDKTEGEAGREYREILRRSVARAEGLAAELARQAGGTAEKRASKIPSEDTTGSPRPKSILTIDDESANLILSKKILGDAGFAVTTAESGFAAIDLFRRAPFGFDLVLLDLTMPFMDGEETLSRLREIRNDIPVILCTGFIQQERLDRLRTIGLAGFLRKPIGADELVTFVNSTLASLRYSFGNSSGTVPVAI